MSAIRFRTNIALLFFALVASTGGFAEEFTWNPEARSISGLLKTPDTRIDLADFSSREADTIIEASIKKYKKRKRELKDLIAEYTAEIEQIEAAPALAPDASEADVTAAATRQTRREELVSLRDAAKAEREAIDPIVTHLGDMRLVLGSPPLLELYRRFYTELHTRYEDSRTPGDGLRHLAIFIGYRQFLETSLQYGLNDAQHRIEFQSYIKAKSLVEDVSFLPHKFVEDVFVGDEATAISTPNTSKVEREMQWKAWPTLWKCATGILVAGALTHYLAGPAHNRAIKDFQPHGEHQVDGRDKENPPDGEAEATEMMQRAAKQMQKRLIGK